jgi:hypothetical protein
MLLDSAEAVLCIFGFNRSLFGFNEKKSVTGGLRFIISVREISIPQKQSYEMEAYQ